MPPLRCPNSLNSPFELVGVKVDRIKPTDWYRTRIVGDDVTHIDEPYIKTFYRCNIWHVRGRDRDMIVDSGRGVVSLRQYVPTVTDRACVAVASHTHFDHIGCHHEFDECLVHFAEADFLSRPTRENTLADQYVSDDIFTGLPPQPYLSEEYAVRGVANAKLIEDGDVIDLGNRQFEVIHTPGHSPGGIALWESKTGILFSGDIVYDGPLIGDDDPASEKDYINSMERLLSYPVRVVHGGHYPSYDGARHHSIVRTWLDQKQQNGK